MTPPNQIAHINIPSELLDTIHADTIIGEFRDEFIHLGESIRDGDPYDARAAVMDWWRPEGMEQVPLSPAEVQRRLTDKIAQLMVVSAATSQQLRNQRDKLRQQQHTLDHLIRDYGVMDRAFNREISLLKWLSISVLSTSIIAIGLFAAHVAGLFGH